MEPWTDLNAPYDLFLQKPFRLASLIEVVSKLLKIKSQLQQHCGQ